MKRRLELDAESVALPKGTRVVLMGDAVARDGWVCKSGSVARVDEANHPHYVVSTPSGHTLDLRRGQLVVQHARTEESLMRHEDAWARLQHTIVLEVVVGSTAWNLAGPDSDLDVRGVFLLPWEDHAGLFQAPDELQPPGAEAQYWEVEKLIRNALRAEANALEALWTPLVRHADEIGQLLRDRREIFVSRRIHGSFGRYAFSQFEKMRTRLEHQATEEAVIAAVRERIDLPEAALVTVLSGSGLGSPEEVRARLLKVSHAFFDRGLTPSRHIDDLRACLASGTYEAVPYRPKNAYNLLRLLHSGIQWMREGEPLIRVEEGRPDGLRERLLQIKRGEAPLEGVIAEARELAEAFDEAVQTSALPEEPDLDAADELLRSCRRFAARRHFGLPQRKAVPVATWWIPPRRFELPLAAIDRFLGEHDDVDTVVCGVTGAHQYGFPSPDSDVDLKAIHLAPLREVVGMDRPSPSRDLTLVVDGVEIDWTSNEAGGALSLLAGGNGNMLERLFSPYTLRPVGGLALQRLDELRHLAAAGVSRASIRHYSGFLRQLLGFAEREPTVKGWLYAYRVALTGEHLLRTGRLLADLPLLLEGAPDFAVARELIAAKAAGAEHGGVERLDPALRAEVERQLLTLPERLAQAESESTLPPACPNRQALDDWLYAWRTERV
jgi:predicted nucleotidyltransferase